MTIHSNTPIKEFIAELRASVISTNARPVIIDKIDALADEHDQSEYIKELEQKIEAMQE